MWWPRLDQFARMFGEQDVDGALDEILGGQVRTCVHGLCFNIIIIVVVVRGAVVVVVAAAVVVGGAGIVVIVVGRGGLCISPLRCGRCCCLLLLLLQLMLLLLLVLLLLLLLLLYLIWGGRTDLSRNVHYCSC